VASQRTDPRSAREIAFDILMEVEQGGFAADLLTTETRQLESRDAGLAAAIVLGVLRNWLAIDFLIHHFSERDTAKLDLEVRMALAMGIYQMRWMDRIPRHAAVSESVNLVKRAGVRSASGFANAVLRKVHRDEVAWPSESIALSTPDWLLSRWIRNFGHEQATKIAAASLETPDTYVRVPAGQEPPEAATLTGIPGCYLLRSRPPAVAESESPGESGPAALPHAAHGFRVTDIGSQSIVPLLGLGAGMTLLDLCASPGNKTAQAMESGAWVVAGDVRMRRMEPLRRLNIPLLLLDATEPLPFGPIFDRILLDAPCSGTGTLAHNPEIKLRLEADDLLVNRDRQRLLLRQALTVLKPGGRLVYSTCSLEPEENEQVIASVCPRRVEQTLARIPGREPGDGFSAFVIF
jgi:16S rRNA (cytosine967-C5)-methyltransferase